MKSVLLVLAGVAIAVIASRIDTADIRSFIASFQPTPAPTPAAVVIGVTATPVDTPTSVAMATREPEPITAPTAESMPPDSGVNFFKSVQDFARDSDLAQPDISIPELEVLVHNLINSERANTGLHTLQFDGDIATIARNHSEDMAIRGYFSHDSLEGLSPTDRGRLAGYDCIKDYGSHYTYGLAENIHQGWLASSTTYVNGAPYHDWNTQEQIAARAVNGWMNSPGHRENILTASYDRAGIGVAIAEDGKVYITQNFC